MKILLLEDDSRVAESLLAAFDLRGHQVDWAASMFTAREVLAGGHVRYDLAILDLNIGLEKGTDLLPLPFPAVVYTGLPHDAEGCGVPVFRKEDPFALLDYIESLKGG